MPLVNHDLECLKTNPCLIGVDEAGRGPLAGSVVAGAVMVEPCFYESSWLKQYRGSINDSKQLGERRREELYAAIEEASDAGLLHYSVAEADVAEIEQLNILGATRLAMERCIRDLMTNDLCGFAEVYEGGDWLFDGVESSRRPWVLVDGKPLKPFPFAHRAIVKGDGTSFCIAMASILAKVTRDRQLVEADKRFPQYGFARHKGYGTAQHRKALLEHGPCELHRMSFLGKILNPD